MLIFGADQAMLFMLFTAVYFNLLVMLPVIVKSYCLTYCKRIDSFLL